MSIDPSTLDNKYTEYFANSTTNILFLIFISILLIALIGSTLITLKDLNPHSKVLSKKEVITQVIFVILALISLIGVMGICTTNQINVKYSKDYNFQSGQVEEYKIFNHYRSEYVYKVYKYSNNRGFSTTKFEYKYVSHERVIPHADVIK